ncbi:MAG TPA: LytTR family DNA-binding domain-containing protein [Chitinophagaceae bacterium]|jgi:DNA-binding LytR/AlgR family response regulator
MRVVVIEDEIPAANRLTRMLQNIDTGIEVIKKLDSVESSVRYLSCTDNIDLIFMDIQLADGPSFNIFGEISLSTPVIFTTAFDQYTLKAFKVNSVDYLLKPIGEAELYQAVEKYRQLYPRSDKGLSDKMEKLMREMGGTPYKERLLIKRGQQLHYLKTEAVAYYYADGKLCYAVDFNGQSHLLDYNLQQLEEQLTPRQFYRINRQLLVNIESIKKIHTWLGGRLKLELHPSTQTDTVVSRERVSGFKEWMGR